MLYYSHVNEDSGIERMLLAEGTYPLVVAVAGSGERVLALMENESVKTIIAVDVNAEALFLLELKIAMLVNLTIDNYLIFIGHAQSDPGFRTKLFQQAKPYLTTLCTSYWEQKIHSIEKGILICGHFEIFMARIRPLLIHFMGKKFKRVLYDTSFQMDCIQRTKWIVLTWFFSRKWVYALFGNKDVAFIGKGTAPEHIPAALTLHLKNGHGFSSFITHLIINGHFRDMDESTLPPSMQKEVLNNIKQRLIKKDIRIEYHHEDLLDFVKKQKHDVHSSTFYSASDILSFENHHYVLELLRNTLNKPGSLIAIRAFLRNRFSTEQLNELTATYQEVKRLDETESSRMYQVIALKSPQHRDHEY